MEATGAADVDPAASAATVSMPSRPVTPLASVTKRMLLAVGLLAASAVIVYLGRSGYRDSAHPGRPLSLLASVYYATITLSTTGFGDIVPVTDSARLVNTVLISPIRVIFLIVLVGTTLEVLTQRTRTSWRIELGRDDRRCGPGGGEPAAAAPERRRPCGVVLRHCRTDARDLHHPASRGPGDRRSAGPRSWPGSDGAARGRGIPTCPATPADTDKAGGPAITVTGPLTCTFNGVDDGIRTRDPQDHNL